MKLKNIYQIAILCGLLVTSAACGDFLEEYSQNQAYVENVTNLDELLIGEGYFEGGLTSQYFSNDQASAYWTNISNTASWFFPYIHLMDDDVEEFVNGIPAETSNYIRLNAYNIYRWQPDPFRNVENNEFIDKNWAEMWSRIAAMNSIIYQLTQIDIDKDEEATALRVEGEARFLRAQFYFWMANIYGQPYCKATAATDPCIPLKTSEDIEDIYFSRATAEKVYGQMVEDLTRATECLRGVRQITKYRTNQAAAFTLLSRVHLYMENYEAAVAAADSALTLGYKLEDMRSFQEGDKVVELKSTETIFTHGLYLMHFLHPDALQGSVPWMGWGVYCSGYTSSMDLIGSYDEHDLRLKTFFTQRPKATVTSYRCVKSADWANEVSDKFAIRLPEVYLNKAEALACLRRNEEARTTIDELRALRFEKANFKPLDKSGDELIDAIRDERRRELCFEGHRWFDLRRYAVNSVHPFEKEIRHKSILYTNKTVTTEGEYVLQPYSQDKAAYVLPIPDDAIDFNKGNLSNEVRPARTLQSINN